jgi:sarcosine oxidase gamma subunit
VWLWRTGERRFELLLRMSFAGYVQTLLQACTRECGIAALPPD